MSGVHQTAAHADPTEFAKVNPGYNSGTSSVFGWPKSSDILRSGYGTCRSTFRRFGDAGQKVVRVIDTLSNRTTGEDAR